MGDGAEGVHLVIELVEGGLGRHVLHAHAHEAIPLRVVPRVGEESVGAGDEAIIGEALDGVEGGGVDGPWRARLIEAQQLPPEEDHARVGDRLWG